MLTKCVSIEEGGAVSGLPTLAKEGEGVWDGQNHADVSYGQPLISLILYKVNIFMKLKLASKRDEGTNIKTYFMGQQT